MTDKEFIAKITPYAIEDMKKNKILASLTIAQAFIESNKGNSGLTTKANNLFGIKGKYNGQSVNMLTTEYYNGVKCKVYADFRKYPSWLESLNDHSAFLMKYKRYASIIGETDYKVACQKMGASGYATSPTYGTTLLNTINKYKLYEIDNEVLGKPTVNIEKPETESKPTMYTVGKTYTLLANLYVRVTPNGEKKMLTELSKNGKLNSYDDGSGFAIMRKGTKVTCKSVVTQNNQTWLQIPSGYVCAINGSKVYVS